MDARLLRLPEGLVAGAATGGLARWAGVDPFGPAMAGFLAYGALRSGARWPLIFAAWFAGSWVAVGAGVLYGLGGRRVPMVKTGLIALAWGALLVGAPWPVVLFGAWRVAVGAVATDLADADIDRRVGLRTLPTLWGERRTAWLLLAAQAVSVVAAAFLPPGQRLGAVGGAVWAMGALAFHADRPSRPYGVIWVDLQYVMMGLLSV